MSVSNCVPIDLAFEVFEPAVSSNKADVILIHGVMSTKDIWQGIAKYLADNSKRKVYTLDMRNHGDSSWSDNFNYEVMANDVAHFMDSHDISTAVLVGHSMGGKVAMTLGFNYPDKVEAMIVEDISPVKKTSNIGDHATAALDILQESLELIPPEMDFPSAEKIVAEVIYKKLPKEIFSGPDDRDKIASSLGLTKRDGRFAWKMNSTALRRFRLDSANNYTLKGLYQKPALFLYGKLSPFNVMKDKDYILEVCPRTQFIGFEKAGHEIHFNCSEEFCSVILKFFEDLDITHEDTAIGHIIGKFATSC